MDTDKHWPRLGCFHPNWMRRDKDGKMREMRVVEQDSSEPKREKVRRDVPVVPDKT